MLLISTSNAAYGLKELACGGGGGDLSARSRLGSSDTKPDSLFSCELVHDHEHTITIGYGQRTWNAYPECTVKKTKDL